MIIKSRRDQIPNWIRDGFRKLTPKSIVLRYKYRQADKMREGYHGSSEEIFKTISFETVTECNYRCQFCPQSSFRREKGFMSRDTFERIIDSLTKSYIGNISLQVTNEPLLDKRLLEFVRIARERCPQSHSYIITNGSLLNEKFIKDLFAAGISTIYVNDYSGSIWKNAQKWAMELGVDKEIQIARRENTKVISSRGGNALSLSLPLPLKCFCYQPFEKMVIAYDGRVVLCCMDYLYTEVMGDATKEDIYDIWFNDKFRHIRQALYNRDRTATKLCAQCDYVW